MNYKLNNEINNIYDDNLNYYTNYMLIKSDATTILHSFNVVKNECITMCQELIYNLYNNLNQISFYIKNTIIPEMFPELFDDIKNYEKIKQFIYNEFNDESRFNEYFNSFLNVQFSEEKNINSIDLENYNNIFFRCYLKGGSAFYFIFNLYVVSLKNISNDDIKLSNEMIEKYLGKKSDYDFDILINENLTKNHYDKLVEIISIQIIYYLKELIYNHPKIFNDDKFIKKFMNKLNINNPPLYPLEPFNKKKIIVKSLSIRNELIQINNEMDKNDVLKNKIGLIYCTKLKFKNAFEEEGKEDVNFILIRLLTEFKQEYINSNKTSNIDAEIFDFSIPLFESYEKKIKWENTKNNIKIDGVYCYNLNSIIIDLKNVIKETIKNNSIGLNKLKKRENRLFFFNNLICIIPRLLIKNNDELLVKTGLNFEDYNEKCEEILSLICKKYMNELSSLELENLKNSLSGIYLNFPETIDPKKLNIFTILKQYFKNKLIDVMNNPVNETNFMANLIFKKTIFDNFDYDNDYSSFGNFLSQYFNIIHLDGSNLLINQKIYNDYCIYIINSLENLSQNVYENSEQIKIFLCKLFVNYSTFINSFLNFFLSYDSIILFIELLYKINSIYENNADDNTIYFTYSSVENYIFYSRNILKNILIENENISNFLMENCTKDIIICTLFINKIIQNLNYKLCLRGSYAYNIIQLLYNNDNNENIINYNDIDSYLILNDISSNDEFIFISKQIYNHYLKLLGPFLENNSGLNNYHDNLSFRIEMRLTDIGVLIQILATIYIPLNSESNINYLFNRSIIGNKLIENEQILMNNFNDSYRKLSFHIFEMNITSNNFLNENSFLNLNEIININEKYVDKNISNIRINNFLNEYNKYLNAKNGNFSIKEILEHFYPNIENYNIDFDNLFIQNPNSIINDYEEIIDGHKDILIKNKYLNRLINLSII